MRKLTPKQEHFAQLVASGSRLNVAYRAAYNSKGNSLTVRVEASRLAKVEHVRSAIEQSRIGLRPRVLPDVLELVEQLRSGATELARLAAAKRLTTVLLRQRQFPL
ncbi:MAG: hypothetical protein ACJ746_13130 [Bryobacteraceae bacterium]